MLLHYYNENCYSVNYFRNEYASCDNVDKVDIKIVDNNGRELVTSTVEKDTADKIAKKLDNTCVAPFNWAYITDILAQCGVYWDFMN